MSMGIKDLRTSLGRGERYRLWGRKLTYINNIHVWISVRSTLHTICNNLQEIIAILTPFFKCLFLRERGQRINSGLCTGSREPDMGLKPTNLKIMTWAEVGCLTDWATQAPLSPFYSWRNWDLEKLRNLSKIPQLVRYMERKEKIAP